MSGRNQGMKNGISKLTEKDVRDIRRSTKDAKYLSEKYGVARKTIYMVKKGVTWPGV